MPVKAQKRSGDVYSWFEENRDSGYLRILAGVRGAGKSFALERIRRELIRSGTPPENVVSVDFESPKNRRVLTCRDALALMDLDSRKGVKHVFLDEVGFFPDHRKLLGVLFADKECRILLSTSNARVLDPDCLGYFSGCYTRYDLFPSHTRTRAPAELENTWNRSFVRDVLGGNVLADAYAEERIAEYISDHVGEFLSSRRVADEVKFGDRRLSHVTTGSYMQHLEDAFLIEKVAVWDAFSESASVRKFAYYFTDPELREYFFGVENNAGALRNRAYVGLRRRGLRVFIAREDDANADFVTVDSGGPRFWKADPVLPEGFIEVEGKLK